MSGLVIDASAALAWLFGENDEGAWLEDQAERGSFAAPWLWRIEVVNAILVKERRGHITQAQSARYFRVLAALHIEFVPEPTSRTLEQLAMIARPHQLTAYDAVYLELAMTLGRPLYTLDKNLRDAAIRVGIELTGSPRAHGV